MLAAIKTLATDSEGNSALHRCKKADEALELIRLGFDVNAKNPRGETPLHCACGPGRTAVVHVLISAGADVNAVDGFGFTPLHDASREGHYYCTKALISAGADVDLKTENGWTPLHSACIGNHLRVAKVLINTGASVDVRNITDKTPLDLCKTDEMRALFCPNPCDFGELVQNFRDRKEGSETALTGRLDIIFSGDNETQEKPRACCLLKAVAHAHNLLKAMEHQDGNPELADSLHQSAIIVLKTALE